MARSIFFLFVGFSSLVGAGYNIIVMQLKARGGGRTESGFSKSVRRQFLD